MTSSGQKKNRSLQVYACIYLAFIYIPVLLLPIFSVNDSLYIAFPLKGFTLKWYESMLTNDAMHRALWNSIKVALAAATISTVLGIFASKAVTRYRMPGKKSVVSVILLPLVIPEIILGTSLLILVNQIGLGLSLVSVVMGHVLINVPFAMAVLISRFEGFDQALEEASSDLGEGAWSTFWRVTLPLVLPGVVSSFLLCFTISFDEFIMAFFLSGTEPTLPLFIYGQLQFPNKLPGVLALGAIILAVSFFVVFFSQWLSRRGTGNTSSSGL